MTAAPIAPSRRSSHAWRRSIALISREAGKVYVTCVLRLRPRPTRPCLPTPRLSLRSVIIAPSARAASRAHGATPRQVALAFLVRRAGVFTIPKAARVEHALENAAAGELTLSAEEEARLDRASPRGRPGRGVPLL